MKMMHSCHIRCFKVSEYRNINNFKDISNVTMILVSIVKEAKNANDDQNIEDLVSDRVPLLTVFPLAMTLKITSLETV